MAIGRISGPLLKSNLIRDGVDLAFETDLLYLDVTDSRIGVNMSSPTVDLEVNGTIKADNLIVDDQIEVGTLTISGNTILGSTNVIQFTPSGDEPTLLFTRLVVDDVQIFNNTIATVTSNANLEINPNGSGTIELQANTNITGDLSVTGNIDATGNITIGGNIVIGDDFSDNLVINAGIRSDIIPEVDNTYDLGTPSLRWRNVYATNLFVDRVDINLIDVGNIMLRDNEITTTTGQDLKIDGNGTGGVQLANFKIVDSTITNVVTNAVTTIQQSGLGYFRIGGTNGFVPPTGTNGEQPTPVAYGGSLPIGMTRYNTTISAIEVWNGLSWASPAGTSGAISEATASDIALRYAVIL
jgi:hypothetical protein